MKNFLLGGQREGNTYDLHTNMHVVMMIAFITFNSSLVPLIEVRVYELEVQIHGTYIQAYIRRNIPACIHKKNHVYIIQVYRTL